MPTKHKPNKGMKKRFRVTATGKLKHNHMFTSHLRSARSSKRKRHLRNASVLSEGHAKNMRAYMGVIHLRPKQAAKARKLAEKNAAAEKAA